MKRYAIRTLAFTLQRFSRCRRISTGGLSGRTHRPT